MDKIEITEKELQKLKIIGQGTEGTIYKYNKNELLKIYYSYYDYMQVDIKEPIIDEDGVNITPFKNISNKKVERNIIQYYDKENVRLSRWDAITKAIETQKDIKLTKLPQKPIYVDGKFKGCSLYYHRHALNIYSVMSIPSYNIRLKIVKRIIEKVEELAKHNIYHIDLCQHPTWECKNTNILLTPFLEPEIIDIDGHSAIYSDTFNEKFQKMTEFSLNVLVLELLSQEYISDLLNNPEDEYLLYETLVNKIPNKLIDNFLNDNLTLKRLKKML